MEYIIYILLVIIIILSICDINLFEQFYYDTKYNKKNMRKNIEHLNF